MKRFSSESLFFKSQDSSWTKKEIEDGTSYPGSLTKGKTITEAARARLEKDITINDIKEAIKNFESELNGNEILKWQDEVENTSKLRTYKTIKLSRDREQYISSIDNRYQRSLLAKFRIGNFPINIEQGRYKRQLIEDRTCPRCPNCIEDEKHYLLKCPIYNKLRASLFSTFSERTGENLQDYTEDEQFYLLLNKL